LHYGGARRPDFALFGISAGFIQAGQASQRASSTWHDHCNDIARRLFSMSERRQMQLVTPSRQLCLTALFFDCRLNKE
jgi:hypothetical protein